MKRIGNVYHKVYDIDNLRMAHKKARVGKQHYSEVKMVDSNIDFYLLQIQDMLINKTYDTSEYIVSTIQDRGKEREISKLPYYPDRIVQWALMLQIEDMFLKHFIYDTYAALPNKGTHKALYRTLHFMKDREGTKYCFKFDIKKFFNNIDQTILKELLKLKIKDDNLLWLLFNIIDSCCVGIPIGNFTSQYFGNYYLSYFDHWMKEVIGIKYYIRYMDDVCIYHHDKNFLSELRFKVESYLISNLKLTLKENWQVFPTYIRGVDFVGYRIFENHILLRKSTATNLKRKMRLIKRRCDRHDSLTYSDWCSINSYDGWIRHCDGFNLRNKHVEPLRHHATKYYEEKVKNHEKSK